jgi:cytoskeleton protein RodZ
MSEIEAPRQEAEAEVEAAAPALGFGRRLADERERKGLSVDDIAARLRLHPKQVRAIESETLPALPAPFLRGFVRNYAKELRLDPGPLIAELNAHLGPQAGEPQGMPAGAAASARGAPSDHQSRRVVLVGVLGALAVFAVLGWVATHNDQRRAEPAVTPSKPAAAPVAQAPAAVGEVQKNDAGSQPNVDAAVAAPAMVAPAPAVPAAPATATADSPLHLTFRGQSWVEVTQADGRVVLSQINEAGTEQRVDGKAPLRLVIGNASSVSIEYKGKGIDLRPVTSADNVARVTLN